jgi:hypothetical protein
MPNFQSTIEFLSSADFSPKRSFQAGRLNVPTVPKNNRQISKLNNFLYYIYFMSVAGGGSKTFN